MRRSNSKAVPGFETSTFGITKDQMDAYDALPLGIRLAAREMPVKVCCVGLLAMFLRHGEEFVLWKLANAEVQALTTLRLEAALACAR